MLPFVEYSTINYNIPIKIFIVYNKDIKEKGGLVNGFKFIKNTFERST